MSSGATNITMAPMNRTAINLKVQVRVAYVLIVTGVGMALVAMISIDLNYTIYKKPGLSFDKTERQIPDN